MVLKQIYLGVEFVGNATTSKIRNYDFFTGW